MNTSHIIKYPTKLPSELCLRLIKTFSDHPELVTKGPKNDYTDRTGEYFYETIRVDPGKSAFSEHLVKALTYYRNENKFMFKMGNWGLSSESLLKHYSPGDSYSIEHCEHSPRRPNRILAWMYYLNTVNKPNEGGTFFPQQNILLNAIEGDLYIWPAGWTHSHYGIAATAEDKYILSGWAEYIK